MDDERRGVIARRADGQHQRFAVTHRADLAGFAFDGRAGVEDVDVTLVAEAFALEHRQCRLGVRVHLADDVARVRREEAGVQREFRHQFGDECLVADAGQVIGLAEFHLEEVPTEAFPERRAPGVVGHTAHFGDDLVAEQLRELSDEQHARLGQHPAVEAVAVIGVQEQRAQLGIAGQVVGQKQRRDFAVDVQLLRSADRQTDAEVVPGLTQADRTGDGGNPHHTAVIVFEHEQIVGIATPGFAAKGLLGPADPVGQALFVGRQGSQAGAGATGQVDQRG